jgi:hypothetical protein
MDLAIEDEGFTLIVAKFSRFAAELYQHARFKRLRTDREIPEVYIRIGPPGTGKSRWLDEQYGLDKWIEAPDNTGKWFDGCELADILVFNDVCLGAVPPLDVFKKLTNRYPFRGAIKVVQAADVESSGSRVDRAEVAVRIDHKVVIKELDLGALIFVLNDAVLRKLAAWDVKFHNTRGPAL